MEYTNTILIVDDSQMVSKVLSFKIGKAGYNILSAGQHTLVWRAGSKGGTGGKGPARWVVVFNIVCRWVWHTAGADTAARGHTCHSLQSLWREARNV